VMTTSSSEPVLSTPHRRMTEASTSDRPIRSSLLHCPLTGLAGHQQRRGVQYRM
jgi:hypothetical protein